METIFKIPMEQVVKARYSVRTYSEQPIPEEVKNQLRTYMDTLSNPFSQKVTFRLLETDTLANSEKLGTYGVIKGAHDYIGATVKKQDFALEAVGYEFEKLILYSASVGLGTCWLGGTFNRGEFAAAMGVQEEDLFPAISPIGYPSNKKHLTESLIRISAKSNQRKPWEELFFENDFSGTLPKSDAGDYADVLEMVRLAPSASNKQPWRIIQKENSFHFYEFKTPGYSDRFDYDIQQLDIGIALCHFHLAALEKGLSGEFIKFSSPVSNLPENMHYRISWAKA